MKIGDPTQGDLAADRSRFGIVAARFNADIVERLLTAAVETLHEHGAAPDAIEVVRVPGAFELPLTARVLAQSGRVDAVIALGCVIRGETPHFDFVAGECARGLAEAALTCECPVLFGVLTTDTVAQADARARSDDDSNKGTDAARAALEMVNVLRSLKG